MLAPMHTHGSDRARQAGDKVILQSAIAKGWTPRVPKTLTHSEHPGTTVLWDEQYFEVIEATPLASGGVRYVLAPWRDDHTIRTFEHYDAASESLRIADHEVVNRQRRAGLLTNLAGFLAGNLPAPVQMHLENELGVRARRMTLMSCVLPMVVLGICIYAQVDARMRGSVSPVPAVVMPLAGFLSFEAGIRFFVAMSQGRPMGSLLGLLFYAIYAAVSKKQLPSASGGRGYSVAFAPPPEDVATRDALTMKEPLLTLLTAAEQKRLAERHGYDYRRTASGVAWVILVGAALGAFTSSTPLSMLIAAAVAIEQALRLVKLRREPAPSVFGIVVRPFVRDLLR